MIKKLTRRGEKERKVLLLVKLYDSFIITVSGYKYDINDMYGEAQRRRLKIVEKMFTQSRARTEANSHNVITYMFSLST